MVDRSIALEALGALCTGNVTSVQEQASPAGLSRENLQVGPRQNLSIKLLIPTVIDGDEHCQVSRSSFYHIKSILESRGGASSPALDEKVVDIKKNLILDEEEFFAPQYNYDFTKLTETETYWRGGEKYERPCGWYRFGLKVLDKYCGNTWLGTTYRGTQSSPGEWPVSYHGTSKKGADGIIGDHYEPGPGQVYGRGIYSTPDISEASHYAKTFTSCKNGKTYKVVLQNRINPEYRKKYNNDLYWLVPIPKGTSEAEEQEMVERAIRPYGLLLKEV
ncbi:uncharacterized protein LOC118109523 isoform X1 [Hippoglossus stenolepis]|uniref:uncharacterized protein LOC118109523 isoform X1 n=1 Tax=Hippoglossus stenolepis TaxID=195615 RepID=UPI001FAF1721|nr:uncharacterized protein LOC118109523 isoform X1 [Hippoglossus stenolepis]